MKVIKWDLDNLPNDIQRNEFVNFLHQSLENYGDEKDAIKKCLAYTFNELSEKETSGFLISVTIEDELVGVCVINETGMNSYIPENILVYIATSRTHRGKGIGKLIMQKVIEEAKGDIALHVESDNPAKKLYEKLGFENKYLEMRLKK